MKYLSNILEYLQEKWKSFLFFAVLAVVIFIAQFTHIDGAFLLFITLLKTFCAYIVIIITLAVFFLTALYEFIYNLFCHFECGFGLAKKVWHIGFDEIIVNWWWNPAIWWHLIIGIILFFIIIANIFE